MPVENATTIGDLNPLWPLGTDTKGEGDDHIRMIKRTLLQLSTELEGASGAMTSAAAFGAIGDGIFHPLQEWLENGRFNSLADIQQAYPKATSLSQSIDAVAIQRCQDANPDGGVFLDPGKVYIIDRTLYLKYVWCNTTLGGWRPAPPETVDPGIYTAKKGATLLLVGTGSREHTVDYVTASRQCGFHRETPFKTYGNEFDTECQLLDLTNKDANGTVKATLREFSVGVIFGSGLMSDLHYYGMKNVRVVTSCPGIGEELGTGGYGNYTSIVPWADWDFGVWFRSPWHCEISASQIVGYYALRGALITTMAVTSAGKTSANSGYAEFFKIDDRTIIQGGTAIRSGDIWPIMAKTADTVRVPWTASHRFPQEGSLVTSNAGTITYTGLMMDMSGPWLVFTGCSSTNSVDVTNSTGARTVIRTTSNGGIANSLFSNSEFTDFCHSTRIQEQSPLFGAKQMHIRACLEISGHPTRAPTLDNNSFYGIGPVALHFGNARDVEGYSNYCEPKKYALVPGGALQTEGAVLIAGAQGQYASRIPSYDTVDLTFYGYTFTGTVNMAPSITCTSGRFAGHTDMCNAAGYFYTDKNLLSSGGLLKLQGRNNERVAVRTRNTEGETIDGLLVRPDKVVEVGSGGGSTVLIDPTTVLQGSSLWLRNPDAGTHAKIWSWSYSSSFGNCYFRTALDDGTLADTVFSFYRTGSSVDRWLVEVGTIDMQAKTGDIILQTTYGTSTRIKVNGQNALQVSEEGVISFGTNSAFRPNTDNAVPFGRSDKRGSTIYLGSAPIVTSDENEKEDIEDLSEIELRVAKKLNPRTFKYKGKTRTHCGFIAQEVKSAFESEGLNPFSYGILCWDSWEEDEEQEAGSRYSLRYEELLSFITGVLLCR